MASNKAFPGKPWEQIKNKLGCLVIKYNDIKEMKNKTGRGAQAKWKCFEEKQEPEENPMKIKNDQ
ncbi:16396_t:CDS:2, partial [Funneliformis geosporum]